MGEINHAQQGFAPAYSGKVTISDLAESLELPKGTVSKALNGYGDISELTKARVTEAADKLGYRPLGHAQAIRTGRIKSVGLVLQTDEHDGYGIFLRDFLAGISQHSSAEGWTLTVASAGSQEEFEEVASRLVEQRKVDGFILPRPRVNDPRYLFLKTMGIPSVLFGRIDPDAKSDDPMAAWYDIDGESLFASAVRRMWDFGHLRIGFVGAPDCYTFAHFRKAGYLQGLAEVGLPFDDDLVVADARTREDGAQAARRLLSLSEPPTAIIYSTDEAALGVYQVATDFGLRLGQDLSLSAYDGTILGQHMHPPLTSFRVDMCEAGAQLSSILVGLTEGESPDNLRKIAAAELVEGRTDGPPSLTSQDLAAHISLHTDQLNIISQPIGEI